MRAAQGGVLAMLLVSLLVPSIQAKAALPHIYNKIKNNADLTIITYALTVAGTSTTFPTDLTSDTTLLAPTDEAFRVAFAKLGITEKAFKANKNLVTYLVQYHTLPEVQISDLIAIAKKISSSGNLPDADFWIPTAVDWDTSNILNGQNSPNNLRMYFRNKKISFRSYASAGGASYRFVNDSFLTIDTVLLPLIGPYGGCKTVAARLSADKSLSSLVLALKTAGLWDAVSKAGFTGTLFAPNNNAFAAVAKILLTTVDKLVRTKSLLLPLLEYHITPARIYRSNFYNKQQIITLAGPAYPLSVVAKSMASIQIVADGSTATLPKGIDLWACKAVIHPIGTLLLL